MPPLPACRWLLLLALFQAGCVKTVLVKSWAPAQIDVAHLNRIVVMEFSGEQGPATSTALAGKLWENEFYTVIDRGELASNLQMVAFSKGQSANSKDALEAARAGHVDGVVVGEVVEYRCEDKRSRDTSFNFANGAGMGPNSRFYGAGAGIEIRDTLVREGTVAVAFRLVDVETGDIRAARQVSKHYAGKVDNGVGHLPSQAEVLDNLLQECLDEIVAMLAPHETTTQVELARGEAWIRGRREVRQGVLHAEQGEWDEAEKEWQLALELDPNNHAALFNLAVAADQRQQYEQAEDFAMQALRLQHKDCYAAGLKSIRAHRTAYEKAQRQRESQIVRVEDGAWE
jgi:tetratricopeptide (TPR) repeat protein